MYTSQKSLIVTILLLLWTERKRYSYYFIYYYSTLLWKSLRKLKDKDPTTTTTTRCGRYINNNSNNNRTVTFLVKEFMVVIITITTKKNLLHLWMYYLSFIWSRTAHLLEVWSWSVVREDWRFKYCKDIYIYLPLIFDHRLTTSSYCRYCSYSNCKVVGEVEEIREEK